jgi:hypothetical protein
MESRVRAAPKARAVFSLTLAILSLWAEFVNITMNAGSPFP